MTLRVIEGFDWLPTTTDDTTIISLLGASQYYQAGSWFDANGQADWEVTDVTAFDYGKALKVNYTDAQFDTLNRLLYPVPAVDEGWTGHRCFIEADHTGYFGMCFMDAATGSPHISIRCGQYGMVFVYLGTSRGTLLITSQPGSFYTDEWFYIEARVKIGTTDGEVEVRINTKTVISLVSANTQNGSATTFNLVGFQGRTSSGSEAWVEDICVDDWYYCDGAGSVNNGFLGNVRVKTQFVIADGTHIDMLIGGTQTNVTLGLRTDRSNTAFASNSSPYNAYNTYLRRVLATDTTTLDSIRFTPSGTSTTQANKAVIFSDNAGVPGTLVASGDANLGFTANVEEVLTFPSAPAVTAGNYYWIGFVSSVNGPVSRPYRSYTTGNEGYAGVVTSYTTPTSIASLTEAPEVAFYAVTAVPMANWQAVQNTDMGETSYVYSDTPGDYDLYDVDPNINAPYVHAIQTRLGMRQDDATQRVARALVQIGAGGTLSEGQDFYLNQSFSVYRDIFELNPDTGVFYSGTEANDAQVGPKVQS